jgi:hypothetical protein
LGKTTNNAADGLMLVNAIPDFKILYVCPLYEQIRRFSNNNVKPFIENSPIRSTWVGTGTEGSVLQRTFANRSSMLFTFAYLDAERVRGASADLVAIDEIQNMDPAHIPIIGEALSHSEYELLRATGTPKSYDNTCHRLWLRTSQAEWFIPCRRGGCGHWNISTVDFDLLQMIGPMTPHISDKYPAIVCSKCRSPINARHGHWVHRYPTRRFTSAGYHIPQIILPLHNEYANKWHHVLRKYQHGARTTFFNEVLGEAVDAGQKLITQTDLQRASTLPWRNHVTQPSPACRANLRHYTHRILSVDWGGGGEDEISYTALAVLGIRPDGKIDVLWGKRLILSQEHLDEAKEIRHWMRYFSCQLVVHDYTGAGVVRETVLIQAGFEEHLTVPVRYVRTGYSDLMRKIPPSPICSRTIYHLDKARSLLYTTQAIKLGMIRFFEYEEAEDDNPTLVDDFLALVQEKNETRVAGDIYSIFSNKSRPDDFAQAVNIGCNACWFITGKFPDFAAAAAIGRVSAAQLQSAGSMDHGWKEDREINDFLRGY